MWSQREIEYLRKETEYWRDQVEQQAQELREGDFPAWMRDVKVATYIQTKRVYEQGARKRLGWT